MRSHFWLLAALLPFIALAFWHLRAPIDLALGDQAQYILHAKALLEGKEYTDNGYIYYPAVALSPAAYPPGLPMLIALVQTLGGSLLILRVVMVMTAVGFFYLAGRYLIALGDAHLAPAAVLLSVLTPQLPFFATGLYTDLAFALVVWGCCLLIDGPGHWSHGRIAAISFLGVLALALRTAGVALIPALMLHEAWRWWKHRHPWHRALVPLVAWSAAYLALDHFLALSSSYDQQVDAMTSAAGGEQSRQSMVREVASQLLAYRDTVSGIHLVFPWPFLNASWHLIALVALLCGAVAWLRRSGPRFLFCFTAVYSAILLLLPFAVQRLLWPLLPAIWFATLEGLRLVYRFAFRSSGHAWRAAVATGLLVAAVSAVTRPPAEPLVGIRDVPQGRELYRAMGALAEREPVRALFFNPRDLARVPGVSAMSIPRGSIEHLERELRNYRINYAILGSMGRERSADTLLRRIATERPDVFRQVFSNDSFVVYRIVNAAPP